MGKFILITIGMGFSIFRCSSVFWFLVWFGNDNQRLYLLITRKIFNKGFIGEFKELIKYKRTFGFTIIAGFVTGSFMVASSQQIFQNQYDLKEEFIFFAGLAIAIGVF
jgi:DHA1 family bicyclomycin/chloramphenicol resistance-like MFS transporter